MIQIGSLYVDTLKYPHRKAFPIAETGWTNEIEEPYRLGSCLVFRFPFTKPALVVGWWKYAQDEESALTQAVAGREMQISLDELLEWE